MTRSIDDPPVLAARVIVCGTAGCLNEGVAIKLDCPPVVVCGGCGGAPDVSEVS